MDFRYDIIVVGGGHAGCEAARISAIMGARTLLITMDMTKLAQMSCNPAMGGIAKGQIVREIDALGGMSGIVTDRSMIQFRMLNRSKGPAMWSPRAQCDRQKFTIEWRKILEQTNNLHIWQEQAVGILIDGLKVIGVETSFGNKFFADAVILTNGTFLNGIMHVGFRKVKGGRSGDQESIGLSEQLEKLGFSVERMKTGTSARVDGRTIDFSLMGEQKGDDEGKGFSFMSDYSFIKEERSCFITHTNSEVHKELEKGLKFSPLFQGVIKGRGPRYCPSVEDKIVTFKDKKSHQLFIEPEGIDTIEYYINGFASSLPLEVQLKALRKVKGLENVEIFRPGYAIEYDFFQPTQLKVSLETKRIENLFFAGQINGTTGYEEAAAQGLMAGINSVLKTRKMDPFVLGREESYIGVLIDDLVTKGVDEPYRMFTSRAEYRILLRQDNADERLTRKAFEFGTVGKDRLQRLEEKEELVKEIIDFLKRKSVEPGLVNNFLESVNTAGISQKLKAIGIASRPQVEIKAFLKLIGGDEVLSVVRSARYSEIAESAEIGIKYKGYIVREKIIADKIKRLTKLRIPEDIKYDELVSISTEGRQKLERIRPANIGQAGRISGVSPSDINILLMYLGR
ncbi:MAG: tRNA uridine-5-carboxymethylaminomethyl(34) synthesis enzyme MnmG [Bacteroidetes bacterium GWE2_41_25]|nr:MAG: tRNA uridine-5-carboxymethylaminomethyl(34) synthesis enzyme MnmG [Bacteroidetes bacterium GWA2_40_15]OFX82747.1 MAG: tRNA uridine-5-carboxymethylaminomethyl(34) synthesis enzyme MnmG [Bacteroidetes bacterium GWC2_40_22]OFY05460.1 MAG: tRNA uridine-5-carboxymethylaminomethyl(34) synthesis enzyme MnmG [Bacteroidetes bacterium GWE2_41_25]OFY58856.1 MAG: tRNA uridine-5-carboxymethylaminomethyl(34) synthesis enzyme MnmG [Bacteroidetes bacterium GWF2_41_9]HBH84033.1 tRNA uridine-5-carboxymet